MPQQGSRAAPAAKLDPRHAANQEKARDLLYKLLKSIQLQLHHLQAPLEQLQADTGAVKEVLVPLAALLKEAQRSMQDLMQQLLPSNLPHLADLILSCALQAASTGGAARSRADGHVCATGMCEPVQGAVRVENVWNKHVAGCSTATEIMLRCNVPDALPNHAAYQWDISNKPYNTIQHNIPAARVACGGCCCWAGHTTLAAGLLTRLLLLLVLLQVMLHWTLS
jgi:hypothetical protein